MSDRSGPRSLQVIYISPNGIGTPLVRSQVLPYLRGLARSCAEFRLVTFERGDPYPEGEFPRARWHGIRAVPGHHLLAKAADVLRGTSLVLLLSLREPPDLFHARSYLPAAIAVLVGAIVRRPYVFDMRGFLGEEYVDAGHWRADDLRYRVLRAAERILLARASAVVVLTERASERLRGDARYADVVRGKPVVAVPCAVDLHRFRPRTDRAPEPTLVYSGSLGMWYLLPEMLRVYGYARERVPGLRFLILNRGERALIERTVRKEGLEATPIEVRSVPFDRMPDALGGAHVGIALLRQVPSKVGSSPVKVAEYLACGLPVVVNKGLGDTDTLVARYAAGHVVGSFDDAELRRASHALVGLLEDQAARASARRLAEEVYAVDAAVDRYARLYAHLKGGAGS